MNASAKAPHLPDSNDLPLLFEALNMIFERRNEDGSFGSMFKNRSPRNKVSVMTHQGG